MYYVNIDKPDKAFTVHVMPCPDAEMRPKKAGTGYRVQVVDVAALQALYRDLVPEYEYREASCFRLQEERAESTS